MRATPTWQPGCATWLDPGSDTCATHPTWASGLTPTPPWKTARGNGCTVLHDDDYVLPGFYDTMRRAALSVGDEVGVLCCQCGVLGLDGTESDVTLYRPQPGILPHWLAQTTMANPVNPPSVVVRRSTYETVGLYAENIGVCADWEFNIRSATRFEWWYEPDKLAVYRLHPDSVSGARRARGEAADDYGRVLPGGGGDLLCPASIAGRGPAGRAWGPLRRPAGDHGGRSHDGWLAGRGGNTGGSVHAAAPLVGVLNEEPRFHFDPPPKKW